LKEILSSLIYLQPANVGQNRMVELNTHKRSDEDLEIEGNSLVSKTTPSVTTVTQPRQPTTTVRVPPQIPITQNDVSAVDVRPKQQNSTLDSNYSR
jgi:hypothetical protein